MRPTNPRDPRPDTSDQCRDWSVDRSTEGSRMKRSARKIYQQTDHRSLRVVRWRPHPWPEPRMGRGTTSVRLFLSRGRGRAWTWIILRGGLLGRARLFFLATLHGPRTHVRLAGLITVVYSV
jgi:hypothetical protein